MKKTPLAVVALGAVAALALVGCSNNNNTTPPANTPAATSAPADTTAAAPTDTTAPAPADTSTPASTAAAGGTLTTLPTFPAGSIIGVSLPQKTSENWVMAEGLFNTQLKAAGYKPMVNFANNGVTDQQNQIQAMITAGAKLIVIGAIDGSQLGSQVAAAKQAGITVIAYDRALTNTSNVDLYIGYDNFEVGVLQGTALLAGLQAQKASEGPPWNIELIAGSPDDANSKPFFDGAMSVLQPKIDDGTLKVPSGQTTQQQAATQGWLAQNAQKRMDAVLAANYAGGTTLSGILSPNDTLARAALTSVKNAGLPNPVITGQDSEVESIALIGAGTQYMTINKDTGNLVTQVVKTIGDIQAGNPISYGTTTPNGSIDIPTIFLTPTAVTQDNLCTAYDPTTAPTESKAALATAFCKSKS